MVIQVNLDDSITWSVDLDNEAAIEKSQISMDFLEGVDFGIAPKVRKHIIKNHTSIIYPQVPHKDSEIKDVFVELILFLKCNYELRFRAYDDGVAYQFVDNSKDECKVVSEEMSLHFPQGTTFFFS